MKRERDKEPQFNCQNAVSNVRLSHTSVSRSKYFIHCLCTPGVTFTHVSLLLPVCLPVMNLDRVENRTHVRRRFPRYHTTVFRGQALWDPYTHVILPPAALVPQRQQQHSWKEKEKERENQTHTKIKGLRV